MYEIVANPADVYKESTNPEGGILAFESDQHFWHSGLVYQDRPKQVGCILSAEQHDGHLLRPSKNLNFDTPSKLTFVTSSSWRIQLDAASKDSRLVTSYEIMKPYKSPSGFPING